MKHSVKFDNETTGVTAMGHAPHDFQQSSFSQFTLEVHKV